MLLGLLMVLAVGLATGDEPQELLEVAESRYKVVAKPEPYKLKPAPPLDSLDPYYDDELLSDNLEAKYTTPRTTGRPKIRVTEAPLPKKIRVTEAALPSLVTEAPLPKVTLQEYLERRKKKQKEQERNPRKGKSTVPKTKYSTDQIIYPTTTYRPKTFEPTSAIAKEFDFAINRSKQKKTSAVKESSYR